MLRRARGLNCRDGDKFVFKCVYIERVLRFPGRSGAFYTVFICDTSGRHSAVTSEVVFNVKATFVFQLMIFAFFRENARRYHRTSHKSTWVCIFSCVLTLSWNSKLLFLFHGVMHNLFPKYDNWCLVNGKTSWCSASWGDAINDLPASLLKVSKRK